MSAAAPALRAAGGQSLLGRISTSLYLRPGLLLFLLLTPPMLWLGVWIGHHSFRKADPAAFKRWVLRLLMLMAVLTAAQGAAGLAG